MSKDKKLRIRNSTAEFLIFTRQAGDEGIDVRLAEQTVWLTQKLMAELFGNPQPRSPTGRDEEAWGVSGISG